MVTSKNQQQDLSNEQDAYNETLQIVTEKSSTIDSYFHTINNKNNLLTIVFFTSQSLLIHLGFK